VSICSLHDPANRGFAGSGYYQALLPIRVNKRAMGRQVLILGSGCVGSTLTVKQMMAIHFRCFAVNKEPHRNSA
jgi:hypothetical protein